MTDRIGWGILGAAWIADRAVLPAIAQAVPLLWVPGWNFSVFQ